MTKNVLQVRMPEQLAEAIEGLVKQGLYKNRSEVVIDAVRHFFGTEKKSTIAVLIERQLMGISEQTGYSKEELDELWDTVRQSEAWKERFGERADEVMATLRKRR
ncbi:MAG: ribbon-helix-helix domain-containing protein [Candidatus Methanospirareceae archaeon]